jgi:hypothetical protein
MVKDHSITEQQYEQALAAKQSADRQLQVLVDQRNQIAQQTTLHLLKQQQVLNKSVLQDLLLNKEK